MSIGSLPPKAAAKLKALQAHAADLESLARSATMRAASLNQSMAFAPPPPDAHRRDPNAMSAEAIQRKAEVEELQSRAAIHHAKAAAAQQLLINLDNFLRDLKPGFKLIDAKPGKLPEISEQGFQSSVGEIRHNIGELDKKLRQMAHISPTKAEKHEAARRFVDGLVQKAKPTIRVSHGRKFDLTFGVANAMMSKAEVATAILAWVSPEQFLARVIETLDVEHAGPAMKADEVTKAMAAMRAELLELERREEAVIELASKHDMFLARRPTSSPLAVLGLDLVNIDAKAA